MIRGSLLWPLLLGLVLAPLAIAVLLLVHRLLRESTVNFTMFGGLRWLDAK
jgi:hypothetical protein